MSASTHSPLPIPRHPFAHTKSKLEIIPNKIDIEEESRLYDDVCFDDSPTFPIPPRSRSPLGPPSVFSHDIWLGDNLGESNAFAREVTISGWTSVGDALGGAYIVYDCVIKTKEGTLIHAHKRYSEFNELELQLLRLLPSSQRHFVPELPPKAPLARYRPVFLARRMLLLQHWLASVLLHPDVGASEPVRKWVMS